MGRARGRRHAGQRLATARLRPSDPANLISAAATRLVLDRPFLGALALRLPARPGGAWCRTVGTDARNFYYNPDYISQLSIRQLEAVLAHEALHCALSHFSRRQHRDRHRWDLACDFAINALLVAEGMVLPPDAVHIPDYSGMTAEEIYPLIEEDPEQEPFDQHLYDDGNGDSDAGSRNQGEGGGGGGGSSSGGGGAGTDEGDPVPPPLSVEEKEILSTQWQQRAAGAAQQALQSGKLSQQMARHIDHLLQSQVPWRALLARFMSFSGRDDFNYHRPSRREGEAIFPSLRSAQVELAIAVDTSGSITPSEMREFLSEIDALKGQVRAGVTLLACDCALHAEAPWRFEPWDTLRAPPLEGGGGTSFVPVFDWLARQDRLPDALVYFTDAEGEFPAHAPSYPVVWLVKGRHPVPFGERIQLN
jgi:predicted metal-dependent peptidase